jgi:hypothetical protein
LAFALGLAVIGRVAGAVNNSSSDPSDRQLDNAASKSADVASARGARAETLSVSLAIDQTIS